MDNNCIDIKSLDDAVIGFVNHKTIVDWDDSQHGEKCGTVVAFDCTTITDVPVAECQALVDLYTSTDGDDWNTTTNWLQSPNVGDWYGVNV